MGSVHFLQPENFRRSRPEDPPKLLRGGDSSVAWLPLFSAAGMIGTALLLAFGYYINAGWMAGLTTLLLFGAIQKAAGPK